MTGVMIHVAWGGKHSDSDCGVVVVLSWIPEQCCEDNDSLHHSLCTRLLSVWEHNTDVGHN